MNPLAKVFASNGRAEVLRLLFSHGDAELYLREIQRQSRLAVRTVQQELKHLAEIELILPRRDGNRLYYRANKDHPIYPEIHSIVVKMTGIVPLLSKALVDDEIRSVFIFGSVARGEAKPESDIDLMVIGSIGLRRLTKLLSKPAKQTGREINPHLFTQEEFSKRQTANDHFLTRVLEEPKLFVIGNEDELAAMGR